MTNLIKNAAIEKAAHIVNTSTVNRIDFRELARQVAVQVFTERRLTSQGEAGVTEVLFPVEDLRSIDPTGLPEAVEVSPWQKPPSFLHEMQQAAMYGGGEFLSLILDSFEELLNRSKSTGLPEPVDPGGV